MKKERSVSDNPLSGEGRNRIVVVDDDVTILSLLKLSLENEGYEVISAENGMEALKKIRRNPPDLVLADIMMPVLDGLKLCRLIKGDPQLKKVYMVLLTARTSSQDKIEGLTSGADDYITKPFQRGELLARVKAGLRTRQMQAQLERKNQELEEALQLLQKTQEKLIQSKKLEAIAYLAAGVAHEVNNPLSVIRGHAQYLQLLIDEEDINRGELEENLKAISEGTSRCQDIVEKLQHYARPVESPFAPVDMHPLIEETVDLLGVSLQESEVELKLSLKSPRSIIMGAPLQIQQVFLNLITNALKAMEESSRKILEMLTEYMPVDRMIKLQVRDTGKGIKKENLEKIFEPFFTTSYEDAKSGDRKSVRVGMGLSIIQQIVAIHNGTISVESREGGGTTFTLLFPLSKDSSEEDSS